MNIKSIISLFLLPFGGGSTIIRSNILFKIWQYFLCLVIILIFGIVTYGFAQKKGSNKDISHIHSRTHHEITQGFNMKLLMAPNGIIGMWVFYPNLHDPNFIGLEYPEGSTIEHLFCGGLWIGALIDTVIGGNHVTLKRVSTSEWASGIKEYPFGYVYEDYISEMTPFDTAHPWRHFSILDSDSEAVSESDYICEYTDTIPHKDSPGHMPLGVKVIQRSYAWGKSLIAPILPIDYAIINIGGKTLRDVYISLYFDPDVGTIYYSEYTNTNYSGYFPELRTVYIDNVVDQDATPLGITILATPTPLQNDNYLFQWFSRKYSALILNTSIADEDSKRYNLMSGNAPYPFGPVETPIKPNQSIDYPGDVDILFSFGPIAQWSPNETLHVAYALVGGFSTKLGRVSVYENAKAAQALYARNYHPFFTTPAPKLRIEPGFKSVTLNWAYTGSGVNPVETWDDANQLIQLYPEDHWRRINPPEGHTTGGRIFEGYRLYRSEDPAGTAKSFVMLRQWDMIDSVGPKFGYDTGIETTFVDENLTTGKTYWYAVTSFGIPDVHVMDYVDWDGSVKVETLAAGSSETSVLASRKRMKLPFSVSNELNKVLVVPNPYRVDEDYTLEMGGYEGRARVWSENKRLIKFIHLPPKCTIRIFTVAGEIIVTLHHEDDTRGEMDWNMLSESNRAIASGLYIFTVESEYGTQTGKFVVIR